MDTADPGYEMARQGMVSVLGSWGLGIWGVGV